MSRILALSGAILLSLLPALTFAAPAHKRHIAHWHGYGFLPGYHQPPNEHVPVFGPKGAVTGMPDYTPQYWHGRYNGGSFGPCWTYTPIGLMWTCG
jgi:hypothetical protein